MISIAVHRYLQFSVVESFAFFYSSLSGFVVLWQGKARLLELLTQVQLEVDGIKVSQWLHIITVGAKFIKKKSPPEQHNYVLINGHRQDLADKQVGGLKPDLTNGHFWLRRDCATTLQTLYTICLTSWCFYVPVPCHLKEQLTIRSFIWQRVESLPSGNYKE